jgi:hypothetical protein
VRRGYRVRPVAGELESDAASRAPLARTNLPESGRANGGDTGLGVAAPTRPVLAG